MRLCALPRRGESVDCFGTRLAHLSTLPEEGQDDFCVLGGVYNALFHRLVFRALSSPDGKSAAIPTGEEGYCHARHLLARARTAQPLDLGRL